MPAFQPGVDLARHYYTEIVRPLLGNLPHTAARLGPGSDVLGFDTPRSTDHDWGPRLELFTDAPHLTEELRHRLPTRFRGWPTHFTPPGPGVRVMTPTDGPVDHYITVTTLDRWTHQHLGFDPHHHPTPIDWLATPWQRLAETTGGAVFHDPTGDLTALRDRLRCYPTDLWRYVLAAQWHRIAQEEPFPARAAEAGDEAGARVETARLTRDIARLLLLLERRWPPYPKWLLHATRTDPTHRHLLAALRADDATVREDAVCTALETAAARQNALGLGAAPPPRRQMFHDRGYAVIDGDRFAQALLDAVEDPVVRGLPLVGCVDQVADNTDVLVVPGRARAVAEGALGWSAG